MSGTAPLAGHMMLRVAPATVPAGQVSLVVSNMGWRTHELVVLPLAAGASAGQRVPGADGRIDETASLGEMSNSCAAGAGDGIAAGAVGWDTVTLPPGNYELVCNLENHYANGDVPGSRGVLTSVDAHPRDPGGSANHINPAIDPRS